MGSTNHTQLAVAALATAGVVGSLYCTYRYYSKRLPQKWRQVGTLKELHIYPIKSCHVISLDQAECTFLGLKNGWLRDRVLMVVDDSFNFITARVYNELLLVNPSIKSSILTLEHPEMDTIKIDLAEVIATQSTKKATVWGNEVSVYDCGLETSEWFTKLLNRPLKSYHLVYYASQECRMNTNPQHKFFNYTKNDMGAFPDDTSYNLINEATVADLNTRLEHKITARQFRPNFIVDGWQPYDEDNCKYVKIGDNVFEIIQPCLRCVMTTIDPETGNKNPNNEPVKTLKTYRQPENEAMRKAYGSAPRMGLQMALRSPPGSVISVNDIVYVA